MGQRVLVHRKRKGGKELGKSWAEERGGFKDERKRERDGVSVEEWLKTSESKFLIWIWRVLGFFFWLHGNLIQRKISIL